MKLLGKSFIIACLFFFGTTAIVHVDRQNAYMNRQEPRITETIEFAIETVENTIEKYASLL